MNVTELIPEVLAVINNRSKTNSAFMWIKNTLNEIASLGRFNFLYKEQVRDYDVSMSLPNDCNEIIDPLFIDSGIPLVGTSWTDLASEWDYNTSYPVKLQDGAYSVINNKLVFPNTLYNGVIMLPYYRNIILPSSISDTTEIDLPSDFVYDLIVYGSARHGLLQEDDYDRLQWAEQRYSLSIERLIAKDGREQVANMRTQMQGNSRGVSMSPWPGNFATEL